MMAALRLLCLQCIFAFSLALPLQETETHSQTNALDAVEKFLNAHNREEREIVRRNLARLQPYVLAELKDSDAGSESLLSTNSVDKEHYVPDIPEINRPLLDYLYQGDIVLSVEQSEQLLAAHTNKSERVKRQAEADLNERWQERDIPFCFDKDITPSKEKLIRQAIRFWENHTCLTFKHDCAAEYHMEFYNGTSCESPIGKQKRYPPNRISIGDGCMMTGIAAHEIAHSLGFYHEQSRVDRDQFVQINKARIIKHLAHNFDKEASWQNNNLGVFYDYGSVMHYNEAAFAVKPGDITIVANEKRFQKTMGSRISPTFADVLEMNRLYQCNRHCRGVPKKCLFSGYPHPKNCHQCICTWGFAGPTCSDRDEGTQPGGCGQILKATKAPMPLDINLPGGSEKVPFTEYGACYWIITAPAGSYIKVKVNSLNAFCNSGCSRGSVAVRGAYGEATGLRYCCNEQLNDRWLTFDTNTVVVSVHYQEKSQAFSLTYQIA
jgi:astacin